MGLISSFGGNLGGFQNTSNVLMSIFTSPMIGGLYQEKTYNTAVGAAIMTVLKNIGFPIFSDKYEVRGGNEISDQVLVTALNTNDTSIKAGPVGALTKIADNIVVNPRVWTIHGYMGIPESFFDIFNASKALSLVFGTLNRIIQDLGQDLFCTYLKSFLTEIASSRRPFKFTTAEGETVPCFFKEWSFPMTAENQNMIEVEFTIQEFRYLALSKNTQITSENTGLFENGINSAQMMMRCAAKAIF